MWLLGANSCDKGGSNSFDDLVHIQHRHQPTAKMEFRSRYSQPFTLADAVAMDISLISDEISRLHNSLHHLKQTQECLREQVADMGAEATETSLSADRALYLETLKENDIVIGSQEERIRMLRIALSQKGAVDLHYNLGQSGADVQRSGSTNSEASALSTSSDQLPQSVQDLNGGDGGIHL